MVRENEIEIRTDKKNMLFCTAVQAPDGNVELISRISVRYFVRNELNRP